MKQLAFHCLGAALVAGTMASAPAFAAPAETISGLAQHPSNNDVLLLHYETDLGGHMYSDNGGKTFRIHPSMAYTYSGARDNTTFKILGDGTVLVGTTSDGLFVNKKSACISSQELTITGAIHGIALHPADANVAFVVGKETDKNYQTVFGGIWKRSADGTLTKLGASDPQMTVHGLLAVSRAESTEQVRLVSLISRIMGTAPNLSVEYVLRYSDNLAQSWTDQVVTIAEGTPRLLAAKAGEPMTVVLGVMKKGSREAELPDDVLISKDSGKTFSPYVTDKIAQLRTTLVAPDGRFFIADRGGLPDATGGVWMAAEIGAPPMRIADFSTACLGWDKGTSNLYVCKPYELGRLDLQSKTYCRMYQLNETVDFICPLSTLPYLREDTTAAAEAQSQLCGYWCKGTHFPSSPFCSVYNDPRTACGIAGRAYDKENGLIEAPGTDEPRCAGYTPAADAGVGDGGAAQDGSVETDAATDVDAGADAAQADAGTTKKSSDGCSVGQSSRSSSGAAVALFSALAMLFSTRRRRAHAAQR